MFNGVMTKMELFGPIDPHRSGAKKSKAHEQRNTFSKVKIGIGNVKTKDYQ